MKTAAKKMSVPGTNNWVLGTEVTPLHLKLTIDGKKMPSGREQAAMVYKLAAELEMRSSDLDGWIIQPEMPSLGGGDKRVIGIRIETALGTPAEDMAATQLLKQIAKEIDRDIYRF